MKIDFAPSFRRLLYSATGLCLELTDRGERNRRRFFHGACGLRILNFHETPACCFDRFARIVERALDIYTPATPDDADALMDGRLTSLSTDRVLFTFDDGYQSNYHAAQWLAERGIRAMFFVVPSFLDRSPREFLEFHRSRGVEAYDFTYDCYPEPPHGLSRSQVKEMHAMGHRIGGHNDAHRNLGQLHTDDDLDYEIGRGVDELSDLLSAPCDDFAFAFGAARHLSEAAARYLSRRCKRIYAAVRGLNVASVGGPPFLTRITIQPQRPMSFSFAAMQGAVDHRSRAEFESLYETCSKSRSAPVRPRESVLAAIR